MKVVVIKVLTGLMETKIQEFFDKNQGIEIIKLSQILHNDFIVTTIVYKDRIGKIDSVLHS